MRASKGFDPACGDTTVCGWAVGQHENDTGFEETHRASAPPEALQVRGSHRACSQSLPPVGKVLYRGALAQLILKMSSGWRLPPGTGKTKWHRSLS